MADTLFDTPELTAAVDHVMTGRFANRFFSDQTVDAATLTAILEAARHAGTGANVQPWQVHVVGGRALSALAEAITEAHLTAPQAHAPEYRYLPDALPEPFAGRRREFGAVFYGSLGIAQDDHAARAAHTLRNFRFFDAPVGLIFTIDRRLEKGSWLDLGMFVQNVMLAAKARGLDTCPQESLSRYHAVIRERLDLAAEELVVCAMSLGFGDPEWALKRPRMPKAPITDFASFHGFSLEPVETLQ